MITRKELLDAIDEYENKENPVFTDCEKLSVFYNLYDKMYANEDGNSYASEPVQDSKYIDMQFSDTDFAKIVDGKYADDVLAIIDELMSILQVTQPNMYNAVLSKIQNM